MRELRDLVHGVRHRWIIGRMTELYDQDVLVADVHPLRIVTFYTRYGDVFGWTCLLSFWILLFWRRVR